LKDIDLGNKTQKASVPHQAGRLFFCVPCDDSINKTKIIGKKNNAEACIIPVAHYGITERKRKREQNKEEIA
jgi:hypothetical protein